jgi:hypothetical protein
VLSTANYILISNESWLVSQDLAQILCIHLVLVVVISNYIVLVLAIYHLDKDQTMTCLLHCIFSFVLGDRFVTLHFKAMVEYKGIYTMKKTIRFLTVQTWTKKISSLRCLCMSKLAAGDSRLILDLISMLKCMFFTSD